MVNKKGKDAYEEHWDRPELVNEKIQKEEKKRGRTEPGRQKRASRGKNPRKNTKNK